MTAAPRTPTKTAETKRAQKTLAETEATETMAAETKPAEAEPATPSPATPSPVTPSPVTPSPVMPSPVTPAPSRRLPARQSARTVGLLLRDGMRGLAQLVRTLFLQGESWLLDRKRATYGLAVTRMLLGLMIFGTLATNFSTRLYTFGAGAAWTGQLEYDIVFTELYLLLALCAVLFAIGYRTRLVMIPLFILWVGFVEVNEYVSDQSDNLTRIALIAMFFTSPAKRWSMDALRRRRFAGRRSAWPIRLWRFQRVLPLWSTNLAHNLAIVVLACQVSFIYVSGGLYKAGGAPWSGGWAIYDPIHVEQFGTWPELSALVTAWAPAVAFATLLTLLVQVSFPLLLLRRGTRIFALVVMLGFHVGIAILMGLPWFSLAMIAIDSIFIRDVTWRHMSQGVRRAWLRSAPNSAPKSAHIQEK
jgi:hypothetical protein